MGVFLGSLLSFLVLLVAFCLLAFLEGRLQGRERPNLDVGTGAVYALAGVVLFQFWGWTSTLVLLGIYVVWTLGGAWLKRR